MKACTKCGKHVVKGISSWCGACINEGNRKRYGKCRTVEKKCACGATVTCNAAKGAECGPCRRAYAKKRYAENTNGTRDKKLAANDSKTYRVWKLRRDYGITEEQVGAMLFLQECKCALCRVELTAPESRRGQKKTTYAIDHDHVTGDVRGILCMTCNTALGGFRDNAVTLERAAQYVSA